MGKLTSFRLGHVKHSYVLVITRGYIHQDPCIIPSLSHYSPYKTHIKNHSKHIIIPIKPILKTVVNPSFSHYKTIWNHSKASWNQRVSIDSIANPVPEVTLLHEHSLVYAAAMRDCRHCRPHASRCWCCCLLAFIGYILDDHRQSFFCRMEGSFVGYMQWFTHTCT